MAFILKDFFITRFLLALYIFRYILIAGSKEYSSMFTFIGPLIVLGFIFDLSIIEFKLNYTALERLFPYLIFLLLMLVSILWFPIGVEYIFDNIQTYLLFIIVFVIVSETKKIDFVFISILLGCLAVFVLAYDEMMLYILNQIAFI